MLLLFINILIILFMPFIMAGIIKKTKSFWGGRKGPSIFQPLYDFLKLLNKSLVLSKTTSFVFKISSVVNIAAVLFASIFVPLAGNHSLINIPADLIIFAYILSLGKFVSLISAMDTGSSFEGMGASREACFSTIVEPAFFITIASFMATTGNISFASLNNIIQSSGNFGFLIIFFAVIVLFIMILVEGSRIPVDDPATHLELTMIHEVMILDNSGIDLALYTWANGIKMFLLSSLITTLIIPSGISNFIAVPAYLGILVIISIIIGTVESGMARIRMSHLFEFIFIMSSLALVILSLSAARMFGG